MNKNKSPASESKKDIEKKPVQLNTDTSLHLGLLADQTKLKPSYDADHKAQTLLPLSLTPDSDDKDAVDNKSESSSDSSHSSSDKKSKNGDTGPSNLDFKIDSDRHTERRSHRSPSPKRNPFYDLDEREQRIKKLTTYNELMRLKNVFNIQLMKEYTLDSKFEDMEEELEYHRNSRKRDQGVEWGKKILLGATWGLEWLNEKYDPFSFQLDGWNEHMNIEVKKNPDYHEVIGELYDKYASTGKQMEPEIKLLLLVCGSAAGFHMTKSLSKHMPGLEDAMKNDPNLLGRLQDMVFKSLNGNQQSAEQVKQQQQFMQQQQLMQQYQQMQQLKQQQMQQPQTTLSQPFNNPVPRPQTNGNLNLKVNERQQLYAPRPPSPNINSGVTMRGPSRDLLNKINQQRTGIGNMKANVMQGMTQLSDSSPSHINGSDRIVHATTVNSSDGENSVKSRSSVKKRTRGPVVSINSN